MKQMFLSTGKEFKEIETFEPGAWIHLVNPSQEEAMKVAERFNIDIQDLRAPLDVEETSRIDVEDDYTLILVDVPTQEERNNKSYCRSFLQTDGKSIPTFSHNYNKISIYPAQKCFKCSIMVECLKKARNIIPSLI